MRGVIMQRFYDSYITVGSAYISSKDCYYDLDVAKHRRTEEAFIESAIS